jgi:hypothetical protein
MCEFSDKICCHQPKARLVASKFSMIVLGGTAALHAYRAWGAVLFLITENVQDRLTGKSRFLIRH